MTFLRTLPLIALLIPLHAQTQVGGGTCATSTLNGSHFYGSCPKSVIDDKHFRSNELRLGGRTRFLQRRVVGRYLETRSRRGACSSGLHGIGADSGPAPELPRAVESPKPFLERRQDNDGDVLALPERRRRIWRLLAKPKQARNFKDLKGLKCRYTFRIRAISTCSAAP